ncbi:GNAT family N-acetyltransferase [Actinospica sp.]|uniref:GNAT family N-acetyltransferase n=1 Tax=Actinospica sp. TaxID=1872142 RepID=UPI002CD09614|nr:GNAT family N-acetyltransferase [Actinospica sp.]HWG23631.1 GNAT family N-acetyltransferase [Actinospica sp.]
MEIRSADNTLTLRPWLPRDVPALVKAHADPGMRRWLLRHIEDEEQARDAIAHQEEEWADGTRFVFAVTAATAVTSADESEPVGSVSVKRISRISDAPGAAEVGYWTASEARGLSIAVRAVEAALPWAAEQWAADGAPVSRFELIHTIGNDASCRVAEKLGFELAEQLPPHPPKFPEPGHLHVRH